MGWKDYKERVACTLNLWLQGGKNVGCFFFMPSNFQLLHKTTFICMALVVSRTGCPIPIPLSSSASSLEDNKPSKKA